ncbi:MAG: zinc dependent phospholipase C family protein [Thermoplasmata archaeon]|nr:zinc dependent phospholipase C family protein [Thermoplasmata archaeon]
MPSTYAHFRLGNEVMERLDGDARRACESHRDLYGIGLHGPDILFYYDALHRNPVSQIGFDMHERPGREFFGPARERLGDSGDAGRAYLYGYICHFALDSEAHPYIEDYIHARGVAHTAIEGEFDRMLLERDGRNPAKSYLAEHIHTDESGYGTISLFYPDVTAEQVSRTLEDMRKYNRLLVAPGRIKRALIERTLRKTGNYDDMIGLVIKNEPDPRCADSDRELDSIYKGAVDLSVELIGVLERYLDGEIDELPARFDRTFSYT